MANLTLTLPWPPQANHYYTVVRGRKILGSAGRKYHAEVAMVARIDGTLLEGRLLVTIRAFPPDRRRRDLDNLLKPLLDSLTKCGAWQDDSQIDDLRIVRGPVEKPGKVEVIIEEV